MIRPCSPSLTLPCARALQCRSKHGEDLPERKFEIPAESCFLLFLFCRHAKGATKAGRGQGECEQQCDPPSLKRCWLGAGRVKREGSICLRGFGPSHPAPRPQLPVGLPISCETGLRKRAGGFSFTSSRRECHRPGAGQVKKVRGGRSRTEASLCLQHVHVVAARARA